jgi:CheY-like chemotaxis protein/anti-sigma regulatory factor (Ser/Thr protein kinase)
LAQPIWCDRLKVQKIALNIISNAIKYTPDGGTVTVSLKRLPTEIPHCPYSLIVEDNGIGMSEEFLQRLYEPFSQEKRSESINTVGTGLGLAIVKRYVDLLGGKISVESKLHEGTRFVVSLPIHAIGESQVLKEKTVEIGASLQGRRMLLCEDNQLNMEIAIMLLKNKDMLVETAENGQAGLEKFAASAEGYYDAVLMDIRMPVMDGYEATRHIRSLQRSDAKNVPIIAMTADAFEESVREAKAAGMNDYVTKPVEPKKLYETLALAIK